MPTCGNCGRPNPGDATYCTGCGALLATPPDDPVHDRFVCAQCGAQFIPAANFCGQCGARTPATSIWRRFRRQRTWIQVVAWVFGYWLLVYIYVWSGTDWPWYAKAAATVPLALLTVTFAFA